MDAYTELSLLVLSALFLPACVLAVLLRPHPLLYLVRGGEAVIATVFALDVARRLLILASGTPIVDPGAGVAFANLLVITLESLLLWTRVIQIYRHWRRNQMQMRMFEEYEESSEG